MTVDTPVRPALAPRILVVDDDQDMRREVHKCLYIPQVLDVVQCDSPEAADRVEDDIDICIFDNRFQGTERMPDLLEMRHSRWPTVPVITLTDFPSAAAVNWT